MIDKKLLEPQFEPRSACEDAIPFSEEKAKDHESCMFDKGFLCPITDKGVKR